MLAFLQYFPWFVSSLFLFTSIQEVCYDKIKDIRLAKLVWQLPCHVLCAITGLVVANSCADVTMLTPDFDSSTLRPYCFYYAYWASVCYDFIKQRSLKDIDHNMMLLHHIATIIALLSSDYLGYRRIGLFVLVLHDCSDVWIMLLKLFYKLKASEPGMIWVFTMTSIIWIYTRIYHFIYLLCYCTIFPVLWIKPISDLIPATMLLILAICNLIWTCMIFKLPFSKKNVTANYEQN